MDVCVDQSRFIFVILVALDFDDIMSKDHVIIKWLAFHYTKNEKLEGVCYIATFYLIPVSGSSAVPFLVT